MSDKFTTYGLRRAAAAVGAFSIVGLTAMTSVIDWNKSWPLVLFYAVLVLNTYFSVRCFASISHKWELKQEFVDVALVIIYIIMALNFNSVQSFVVVSNLLFIVAILKYILLAETIGYSKLLREKIRVNAFGILYCFLALIGILWGYGRQVVLIWSIGFAIVNVYVLLLKPLYNPINHYENRE